MPRYELRVVFGCCETRVFSAAVKRVCRPHTPAFFIQESATADSFYIVRHDASVQALNSIFSGGH